MRPTTKQVTGDIGETEVDANFQRLNWAPSVKFRQDIGDDLMTIARSATGVDLGMPVVYQVKSSREVYREPAAEHEGQRGWWWADAGPEHFDHWVKHGLPQLLVLHDVASRVSYWVHVTGDKIVGTGKGSKIFVPAAQRVSDECVDDLLAVAMSGRGATGLEGSAWTGMLAEIGPSDRLRYALITPRLIAPHGNQSVARVESEAGLALIAGVRLWQYSLYQSRSHMPDLAALPSDADWQWQLTGALFKLLSGGGYSGLADLVQTARHPHEEVAARVLSACAAWDAEDDAEALAFLVEPRRASDVDRGWILAQRARMLSYLGRSAEALSASENALELLATSTGDPTATALRAGAVWVAYQTASADQSAERRDPAQAISTGDNAVRWWRAMQSLDGLRQFQGNLFDERHDGSSGPLLGVTFANQNGHNHLAGSLWNAAFSADVSGWNQAALTLALHTLSTGERLTADEVGSAFSLLARSASTKELAVALHHYWEDGPIAALREFVAGKSLANTSYDQERAILIGWAYCGDLLRPEEADAAIGEALELIENPNAVSFSGTGAWTLRLSLVRPAVCRLLASTSSEGARRVAEYLVKSFRFGGTAVNDMVRMLSELPLDDPLVRPFVSPLRQAVEDFGGGLTLTALNLLASHDEAAQVAVDQRAAEGSGRARDLRIERGLATTDELAAFGRDVVVEVESFVQQSHVGMYFHRGYDVLRQAAWIAHKVDDDQRIFATVLDALFDPKVLAEHKQDTLWYLIWILDDLREPVIEALRSRLREDPTALRGQPDADCALRALLGLSDPTATLDAIVDLLGSAESERRSDAALVIGRLGIDGALEMLTPLAVDREVGVRATACAAIVRVGARSDAAEIRADQLLRMVLQRDGCRVPRAIASAIREHPDRFDGVRSSLRDHPSAIVRRALSR